MTSLRCSNMEGHSHPVVEFGTKEWIAVVGVCMALIGMFITVVGLFVRAEHRTTVNETTAQTAVSTTATLAGTTNIRLDRMDTKMEDLGRHLAEGDVQRERTNAILEQMAKQLDRIEKSP